MAKALMKQAEEGKKGKSQDNKGNAPIYKEGIKDAIADVETTNKSKCSR